MQPPAGHLQPRCPIAPGAVNVFGRSFLVPLTLTLMVLWLGASPGNCVNIFVLISGVAGESTGIGHAGWTDAVSWNHTITRTPPDFATHGTVGFTKPVDKGTPVLYDLLSRRSNIANAQIEFWLNSPAFIRFYRVDLTNVVIASVRTPISAADSAPTENVSLHYESIAWSYTEVASDGHALGTTTAAWNRINKTGAYNGTSVTTDADQDGLPDAYELAHGLNPNVNDANGDLDGDGLNNYQEYLAGTDPNNFNSVFRVTKINLGNGMVRVTWNSVAGKTYRISSASQADGAYTQVSTVPSAGNGETFADFPDSPGRQFYRVAVP